jgi:hypothetical protein
VSTSGASEPIGWEPLVLTPQKIYDLWRKISQFPIIFDDFGKGNYNDFINKLLNPMNAFADIGPGLGLGCILGIKPRLDATVHVVMFDRRLKGREPVFRDILRHCFEKLQLRRLTAIISEDAVLAVALVKRLGFTLEGTMRKAMLREGRYVNVYIYGLLREELHEDRTHSS